MKRACAAGATLLASLALSAGPAAAQEKPYSPYEREAIAEALEATGGAIDRAPEGKTVEEVVLRRLDVFEPRDPLPGFFQDFLNAFHATSRPLMVDREVLVRRGEPWVQRLVDETARNLRSLRQLSLVLCVPLVGSAPDRVKLLVVTKDIWSLRLNSDFRFADGQLETLLLAPSEENLGGLHHSLSLYFLLEPDTYSFGAAYRVPRIQRSYLQATLSTNVILNRESGDLEGVFGSFSYGEPLYTTRTPWGWSGSAAWRIETTRFFNGMEPLTYDADATADDDRIPIEYHSEQIAGRYGVTRSFGWQLKHDVSFGAEASRKAFHATDGLARFDARARAEFVREQIPQGDERVYPYVGYASYTTNFKSFVDFNTLGLQEDYRLGHDLYVKSYPVFEPLSSRSFFGTAAGAAYTVALGDGLVRAYVDGVVEASPERVWDASLSGGMRAVSPRLGFGRLVLDGTVLSRFENYLNERTTLGGEGRLRGYPSGAYRGEDAVALNVELRSRPLELWTVQVGAATFYDAGAAVDEGEAFDVKQSLGTGLRIVFPQLDRSVMRLDWAVPLETDPRIGVDAILPGRFVVTFKQAFGMPSIAPPSVLE